MCGRKAGADRGPELGLMGLVVSIVRLAGPIDTPAGSWSTGLRMGQAAPKAALLARLSVLLHCIGNWETHGS